MAVLTIWIDESGEFVGPGDHIIAAMWSLKGQWDVKDVFSRRGWSTKAFHACEVTREEGKAGIAEAVGELEQLCDRGSQGALIWWCRTTERHVDFHVAAVVSATAQIASVVLPDVRPGDSATIKLQLERRSSVDLGMIEAAVLKNYLVNPNTRVRPNVLVYAVPKGSSEGLAAADLLANYAFHLARQDRLPADWPAQRIPVRECPLSILEMPPPASSAPSTPVRPVAQRSASARKAAPPPARPAAPAPKPALPTLDQAEYQLELAEQSEHKRDFGGLTRTLDAADRVMTALPSADHTSLRFARLMVLRSGLRQAQFNHGGGAELVEIDPDLNVAMERLLQENPFDYAVALFHNRRSVAGIDSGDWQGTNVLLEQVCRAYAQVSPGPFRESALRHREIGALLGTHGQTLAFLAQAARMGGDLVTAQERLDDAEMRFMEAREHFDALEDRERQAVYIAHCHLARAQVPGSNAQQAAEQAVAELETAFGAANNWVEVWRKAPNSGRGPSLAFAVAALLKAQWTGQLAKSWIVTLVANASTLAPHLQSQPSHPHQIILGYLAFAWHLRCADSRRPNLFAQALEAADWPSGLVRGISRVFLAEWQSVTLGAPSRELAAELRAAESFPEAMRPWFGDGTMKRPGDWLRLLPFNYA